MTDDSGTGSRLPFDPGYWDELSRRSIEAALAQPAAQEDPWWSLLSERAYALAAAAAFALLGGSLLLGARQPGGGGSSSSPIAEALAPDQPLLATMMEAGSGLPTADLLFNLMALREGEDR